MSKAKKAPKTPTKGAPPALLHCWDLKACGREQGGAKTAELGLCPAWPDHGRDCWRTAGTLCGGAVQGTYAEKVGTCLSCEVYQKVMCGDV
ncbi:MAG: two-CW domain-containing protein [Myxococcaceae bacterium]